ncbi:MAG TPA: GNAT family N-acetyltransferase [Gammaproteobacteria bacterium]|nr:GNAT family N-acetyltransferase [Gammaproteobacteria bacterium]
MEALEQQFVQAIGEVPVAGADGGLAQYHIEVIGDAAELARIKPEWDELLAKSGIDHPFLSHEWITSWWECFGSGKTLHVLLARSGRVLTGIAPLMRGERKLYGMRASCLEALYNPHTPRFDFIVVPAESEAVYHGLWNHLRGDASWDFLELSQLRADSPTLASLARLARRDGCATGVWHGEHSPYIPFNGTFEAFFSRLGNNQRSELRRRMKRLQERGSVRLEEVTEAAQIDAALNEGFRIEAAAWKAHTATAISSAPEVEAFYRAFARRAAATGMLRLIFLTVGGRRIAFAYALQYCKKLYALKTGYDPEYSYYSPYNLLCYLVYQNGFERGLDEYEFLGSNEAWKLVWTKLTRRHDWLYVFARRPRARLLYLIKFRWMPLLQRQPCYRHLRDLLYPKGKARLGVRDGERVPSDRN